MSSVHVFEKGILATGEKKDPSLCLDLLLKVFTSVDRQFDPMIRTKYNQE